jgi:hypothetical protein
MIHFVPDSADRQTPAPYAEAVARLASLRQALQLVEGLTGAAPTAMREEWPAVATSKQPCFDALSARTVAGSAAGLEAIAALRAEGLDANPAAAELLAKDIRAGLEELGVLLSL